MDAAVDAAGEPVALAFANVDVRDVVRSVLGDTLKLPYVIDPAAQGSITLQTGHPIPRTEVLPALESSLRLAGLAVIKAGGLYRIVPLADAGREVTLSDGATSGFVAQMVTPRYASAADLGRLLEPLVPPGTTLRAVPSRNLLIITGPAEDVKSLLANVSVFDVDYLRGVSTALLPLKSANVRDVAQDVTNLLNSLGDGGQLVHVVPLERLNALLVTSMRPDYLDRVRRWVERFDTAGSTASPRLFVYRVQNGRAKDLATVLRTALGLGTEGGSGSSPGNNATAPDTSGGLTSSGAGATGGPNPLLGNIPTSPPGGLVAGQGSVPAGPTTSTDPGAGSAGIRITADETNNALLVLATQPEYTTIEAALRQLDIPPLQVMVEATLAEVTLTDQLAYGLQYYIKSGNFQALLSQTPVGATSTAFSGFPFAAGLNGAYGTVGGSNVILQALAQLTRTRVLSSPNLLAMNNQTSRIQVGDEVPIATGSAVSTIGSNSPIVNSIEYRDTGIILKVTPRVNASGVVALDISEEVSEVSSTTTSSLNSPTISERRVDTTVSVNDGQTVALGGLIQDSRSLGKNGIPILQDIPAVGWLFGQRSKSETRTELIAILTPHVIRNPLDARLITEELQAKLPLTIPVYPPVR